MYYYILCLHVLHVLASFAEEYFFFCVFRTWAHLASFLDHFVVPFRDGGLTPLPNRLETRKLEWQSHAMVNLRSLVNAKIILVNQR